MTATMTKRGKQRPAKKVLGAPFTMEEVAAIKTVAARLNPACPKNTEAIRHLLALGYQAFFQINDHRGISSPPSMTYAAAPSVESVKESVPQKGQQHKSW